MSDREIWNCGKRDHFGFQCQHFISIFIFPFDYGKIVQGLVFKRLEIIQRNHKLLPTYIRNVGLLNLLKYFASQISIWWGFIGQFQAFFLHHRGHTSWCVFLPSKLLHNSQAIDLGRIRGVSPNYVLHFTCIPAGV